MADRVKDSEIKKAASMASRKNGVTRRQLAEKLEIKPQRAKVVIERAMREGAWSQEILGSGRNNRTITFYKKDKGAKPKAQAKPYARAKAKAKKSPAQARGRKPRRKTKVKT